MFRLFLCVRKKKIVIARRTIYSDIYVSVAVFHR